MHFAANQDELDNGMLSFTFEWAPYGKWTKANKALVHGVEKNHLSFKAYK
jgi:hypothetical protein